MVADFKAFASGVGVKIDEEAFEADPTFIKAMIRYDIDLALFGVAAARRHLFAADPQAQFALSLFPEAEQLTQLSRSRAARNKRGAAIRAIPQEMGLRIGLATIGRPC